MQVTLSVDGELRVNYNTDDLAHSIAESIEFVAAIEEISPGDVLFMGTNHQGLGAMQDGDTIEMGVEGVGRFTFTVSDPLKRRWPRGVDEASAKDVREGAGGPGRQARPLIGRIARVQGVSMTPLLIGESRLRRRGRASGCCEDGATLRRTGDCPDSRAVWAMASQSLRVKGLVIPHRLPNHISKTGSCSLILQCASIRVVTFGCPIGVRQTDWFLVKEGR